MIKEFGKNDYFDDENEDEFYEDDETHSEDEDEDEDEYEIRRTYLNLKEINSIDPPNDFDESDSETFEIWKEVETNFRKSLAFNRIEMELNRENFAQEVVFEYNLPILPTQLDVYVNLLQDSGIRPIYQLLMKFDYINHTKCWKKRTDEDTNQEILLSKKYCQEEFEKVKNNYPDLWWTKMYKNQEWN
jgi:hypothetical protein